VRVRALPQIRSLKRGSSRRGSGGQTGNKPY